MRRRWIPNIVNTQELPFPIQVNLDFEGKTSKKDLRTAIKIFKFTQNYKSFKFFSYIQKPARLELCDSYIRAQREGKQET